jgi:V/A-type H+-transporting ATPase subunit K
VGAAAMGAVAEKPELMGKSLIYVALAEGIAIYGLLISIVILSKI